MRKKDKFDEIKPDAFEYQQMAKDDITPAFFIGVIITLALGFMLALGLAFIVASGIIFIGSKII